LLGWVFEAFFVKLGNFGAADGVRRGAESKKSGFSESFSKIFRFFINRRGSRFA
jgi:hypothetical protein